ncbi:retrovirus-related pol polyprotein from transposon TNT 1-94 [Tanacetum coccineum]
MNYGSRRLDADGVELMVGISLTVCWAQTVGYQNGYNAVQKEVGIQVDIVHVQFQNRVVKNIGGRARGVIMRLGNNGNQIRCYNCRGLGHLARNCTVRPRRRDAAYLRSQLLIDQTGRKKQQASTSGTQTDNAPVYDSDGSAEEPINKRFQVSTFFYGQVVKKMGLIRLLIPLLCRYDSHDVRWLEFRVGKSIGHLFDELSNGENQVVSKSSDVTTADASV